MRWLWLEKKCHYLIEQRAPRFWLGSPDILGVTAQRFLIEVEVKRSVVDFKRDADKRHRRNRERFLEDQAKLFYYMMPAEIADKVFHDIPEWAGVLIPDANQHQAQVMKPSPVNNKSRRLSLKECAKMCRYMTNWGMSSRQYAQNRVDNFLLGDLDWHGWPPVEKGIYQI